MSLGRGTRIPENAEIIGVCTLRPAVIFSCDDFALGRTSTLVPPPPSLPLRLLSRVPDFKLPGMPVAQRIQFASCLNQLLNF